MEIHEYIQQKKIIYNELLEFIDNERDCEENYQNLLKYLSDQQFLQNRDEIENFLYLISQISKYHHRSSSFYPKIEKIFQVIKNEIQINFSNFQIFRIFKQNKRIILFLLTEKILNLDKSVIDDMNSGKFIYKDYFSYFLPETKTFINVNDTKKINADIDSGNDFENKRIIGENDELICNLIRNDLIDEFISYVNKTNFNLSSQIKASIFETNLFLIKNRNYSLIQYSAFFGSMQIFKYLHLNGAKIKPNICLFAVHGDNPEMIHYLEEKKILSGEILIKELFYESIKCHHNEIANYIQTNYLHNQTEDKLMMISQTIKYYNYSFFPDELNNNFSFYYLCKHNYLSLVKILVKAGKININSKIIS